IASSYLRLGPALGEGRWFESARVGLRGASDPSVRAVEVVRYRVMAHFRSEKAAGAGRRPAPAGGETGPVRLATAERAWSALRGLRCGGRRRVGVGQALSLR